jgi:conserved oligomeric Golgi complex subunit 6
MRSHINAARQETGPVLGEASSLTAQKEEVETKQKLLDGFKKHFIVDDEELSALTSASEPVNDRFFQTLARVKQIHRDCEVLLGSENQRLGVEIMDQSSRTLNNAFQKLYRWVQKEFKTLNLEDPQINTSIRRALRVLAERPSLFQNCLDFFAEAREHILSDAFHFALTQDASNGEQPGAKPIEFSAHDTLRYVGDMLAWTHSTTVSEREALEGLFISDGDEIARGIRAGISNEPWSNLDGEEVTFDGRKALNELVNRDLNGVARALKQRVALAVQAQEEVIVVYKTLNLLTFYHHTLTKLVGTESGIGDTISSLQQSTFEHFQSLLQDQIAPLTSDPSLTPPADLSPPDFLTEALDQLKALMKAYDGSFRPTPDGPTNSFTPILETALDPFLAICNTLSTSNLEPTNPTAAAIFITNNLLLVSAALTPFPFTHASHLTPLSTHLTSLTSTLTSIQHAFFLHTSGLHPLLSSLAPFSTSSTPPATLATTIPTLPPFQTPALTATAQALDDFLPSALIDATDNLKRLQNPKLVTEVTEQGAERFCEDFEFVVGWLDVHDEGAEEMKVDGEEDEDEDRGVVLLRDVFPRTAQEVRVLLS